jgi:1-phosphofructokinase family hexose kinase
MAVAFAAGYTGQALAAGLTAAGIPTHFVYLREGETRTNVVIQEPNGRRHIKANQPGATVTAADQEAFWEQLRLLAAPGDLWVLTGSLAPGLEPGFYAEAAEQLRRRGAQFALDTSGPALRLGCAAGPALVKPNVFEAEEFTGRKIGSLQDAAAAARAFLEAGARFAVLSLGREGAIVADAGHLLHVQPPAVTVQTAVGAGDAVVAGAIYALRQGAPAAELGAWAVATGTLTAMHDDLPPNPHARLAEIARQVKVDVLG